LPPRHNGAAVAAVLAAVILAAAVLAAIVLAATDRTGIPTVDRTLMGRAVISTDRVVMSSSEVVSTTHSGDRSIRTGMDIRTVMDIRMGMDIRMDIQTGLTIIRRTSRVT